MYENKCLKVWFSEWYACKEIFNGSPENKRLYSFGMWQDCLYFEGIVRWIWKIILFFSYFCFTREFKILLFLLSYSSDCTAVYEWNTLENIFWMLFLLLDLFSGNSYDQQVCGITFLYNKVCFVVWNLCGMYLTVCTTSICPKAQMCRIKM